MSIKLGALFSKICWISIVLFAFLAIYSDERLRGLYVGVAMMSYGILGLLNHRVSKGRYKDTVYESGSVGHYFNILFNSMIVFAGVLVFVTGLCNL